MRLKRQQLIWILCFLIIGQTGWLDFRLNKLIKNSPTYLAKQKQKQTETELRKIPEVKIEENLPQGAELWLKSQLDSSSSELKLEIWLKSERPIKKADLRLFYPPDLLQIDDSSWQVEKGGVAYWSGKIEDSRLRLENSPPGAEFLIKEIKFKKLKEGKGKIAKIEFDFSKESLLDCNLFDEKGNDILEKATGGKYLINDF